MKVCVNCKHSYEYGTRTFLCRKGGINPIYGIHEECFDMRELDGTCGKEGKLFEPEPEPKPTLWKRLFGFKF